MVLVGYNSFYEKFAPGFIGIECVIRQFLASQDLIVDMIFEWLEFLVEVQTEKNRKANTKNRKLPKKQKKTKKKNRTLPQISNLGLVLSGFFWAATPPNL